MLLFKMIGPNLPISEKLRDPIEAAVAITLERKIVSKYVPVGDHTKQEEIFAPIYWWGYVNFNQNTQLRDKRTLLSVGAAAIIAGKEIARGTIKDFVKSCISWMYLFI